VSEVGGSAPDLSSVLAEAHALVERRRVAHARTVIAQGLRHFPQSSELLYLSASIDYIEDNNDSAMRAIREVLAVDPQHYGARRLCAHLHEEAKEFAKAEALWIGLLREYPENPDCYAPYAELMLRTLNIEKASRLAHEGLRHHPDHAGCLHVAALVDVIEGRGSRSARSENLQRLLREHPEHLRSSTALVVALMDRGQHRDALRVAQELLRNQPDSRHLVDLVRELKMQTHWTMMPLYPMQRWGWGGAIALSIAGIVGLRALDKSVPEPVSFTAALVWIVYVVYSWVWPSILRKLV
jgi:predicted Zn-dependent protease